MDDFALFRTKKVRSASEAERKRFKEAFDEELKLDPKKPPGPAALQRRMGRSGRQLNGRLSKLRRTLLVQAGFAKSNYDGTWWRHTSK